MVLTNAIHITIHNWINA